MGRRGTRSTPPHAAKKRSTTTPPRAAKKRSTKNNVMIEDEEDHEDDTVDTSVVGESTESDSDDKSEDSEAEESDAEPEAESDSSDDEASVEKSENNAEGEEDNEAENFVNKTTRALIPEDDEESAEADDDSSSYTIDREAEVNEEDKVGMSTPTFSDARVQAFIKDNKIDKKDYASFYKMLNMPKVKKHLTPEQSHHILQFIGKNLDPYNTTLPTTKEARSFLYYQELILLFCKKEKKKKEKKGKTLKDKDGKSTCQMFFSFLFFIRLCFRFFLPYLFHIYLNFSN